MGLMDFTYRLKAESGDTNPVDEVGGSITLTGGTITLQSNGGSDYAWQFVGAATATGPSKAITAETDGGGITIAVRLKIVSASSTGGATYAAWKENSANPYALSVARNSGTEVKGRYRTGAGINDTSTNYTHGSGFVTYVVKLRCLAASTSDAIQVWRSDGSGSTTPDMASSNFTAGNLTVINLVAGVSDATVQISDWVLWSEELTAQECADLAVNGIRTELDGGGGGGSIAAISNYYRMMGNA